MEKVDDTDFQSVADFLDGWIYMLHPNNPEHTQETTEILEQVIQYAQANGVRILTMGDAYEIFGNALEVGDYTGGSEGFALSFSGEWANLPTAGKENQ